MRSGCDLDAVWMRSGSGLGLLGSTCDNLSQLGSFWDNFDQLESLSVNFVQLWLFWVQQVNLGQLGFN